MVKYSFAAWRQGKSNMNTAHIDINPLRNISIANGKHIFQGNLQ